MWKKPPGISMRGLRGTRAVWGPPSHAGVTSPGTWSQDNAWRRHAPGPGPGTVPRGAQMSEPGHWFERNPLWFKTAIFYEIHIRGFFDGNDDGSGDFRGLIEKLDYLQWLG